MNLRRYLLRLFNFCFLQWLGLRLFVTLRHDGELIGAGFKYGVLPLTGWWDEFEPFVLAKIGSVGWVWGRDDAPDEGRSP